MYGLGDYLNGYDDGYVLARGWDHDPQDVLPDEPAQQQQQQQQAHDDLLPEANLST